MGKERCHSEVRIVRGPQGLPGPQGPQGPVGFTGPTGASFDPSFGFIFDIAAVIVASGDNIPLPLAGVGSVSPDIIVGPDSLTIGTSGTYQILASVLSSEGLAQITVMQNGIPILGAIEEGAPLISLNAISVLNAGDVITLVNTTIGPLSTGSSGIGLGSSNTATLSVVRIV